MSQGDFKKGLRRPVNFKKGLCRMSLKPKNGCVTLSILGDLHPERSLLVVKGN